MVITFTVKQYDLMFICICVYLEMVYVFGGCQHPVTVGKQSAHFDEGIFTNLHHPLVQCLGMV